MRNTRKQEERRNNGPFCQKGPRNFDNQFCLLPLVLAEGGLREPVNMREREHNGQLERDGVQQDTLADLQKDAPKYTYTYTPAT
jgi:hypothetical protein